MAYRRSLTIRGSLLTQRFLPSPVIHILHGDDDEHQSSRTDKPGPAITSFLQRGYCNGGIGSASSGVGALFRERGIFFSPSLGLGSSFCNYSTSTIGEGSDKIDYLNDVAEVLSENGVEAAVSTASAVSEVALAAADSFYPVACLQYLIDGVHSFTGLGWWASIALTTIMIRTATVPLLINQLKCTTKLTAATPGFESGTWCFEGGFTPNLQILRPEKLGAVNVSRTAKNSSMMRPHLEEIKVQMQKRRMDPEAVAEGQKQMKELFREYGVTPFTPLKGLFIQGPIFMSFFFAIMNMVEKVPSLKEGGAFWFTDLTTPDSLYIFPVLTALTFLITVECNMQEGLEGNPVAGTIKNFSRGFAVLTIPLTMTFPKAIFCYWVTSNLFSLMYGLVIKRPEVKGLLGVPILPNKPATASPPTSSVFSPAKGEESPSLNDISERLKNLEEQVKARNKDE